MFPYIHESCVINSRLHTFNLTGLVNHRKISRTSQKNLKMGPVSFNYLEGLVSHNFPRTLAFIYSCLSVDYSIYLYFSEECNLILC